MIFASQEIEREAMEDPEDVHTTLDAAQQKFYSIGQSANPGVGIHIKELLSGVKAESKIPYLRELQERQEKYQVRGYRKEISQFANYSPMSPQTPKLDQTDPFAALR